MTCGSCANSVSVSAAAEPGASSRVATTSSTWVAVRDGRETQSERAGRGVRPLHVVHEPDQWLLNPETMQHSGARNSATAPAGNAAVPTGRFSGEVGYHRQRGGHRHGQRFGAHQADEMGGWPRSRGREGLTSAHLGARGLRGPECRDRPAVRRRGQVTSSCQCRAARRRQPLGDLLVTRHVSTANAQRPGHRRAMPADDSPLPRSNRTMSYSRGARCEGTCEPF